VVADFGRWRRVFIHEKPVIDLLQGVTAITDPAANIAIIFLGWAVFKQDRRLLKLEFKVFRK
jgi:hypothetical protein